MEQVGLAATSEVTLWSLFMQAGFVVKFVMLGLIGASIWTWAIVADKWISFNKFRRQLDQFEQVFWSGQSLEDSYQNMGHRPDHPMSTLFVAAMREWRRSAEIGSRAIHGLQERIDRVMTVSIAREAARLERGLLFLATVGATAPFIGLFGTVWGIMNSFQAIAASKNTSLAIAAPGIAEALFATALGLVAAIVFSAYHLGVSAEGLAERGGVDAHIGNRVHRNDFLSREVVDVDLVGQPELLDQMENIADVALLA